MKTIILFMSSFILVISGFSQAGSLDVTFGDDGRVYTNLNGQCFALGLQTGGKILAGGTSGNHCVVIRYLSTGEVDSSFGENGIVKIPDLAVLNCISVLEDDYILAGGATPVADVAIAKLQPDGSFDSAFGKDGVAVVRFETNAVARAMQIQKDGKIVLGGWINVGEEDLDNEMVLVRLNSNGSLDEDFGDGGKVQNSIGYQVNDLALQEDGKIVTAGQIWPPGHGDRDKFCISRYNTDGSLDNSFAEKGNALTDITDDANDIPYSVAILSDGRIIAAGMAHADGFSSYMAAVKYNSDGTVYKNFGENGVAKIIFEKYPSSEAKRLLVQTDGKLVLTGSNYSLVTGHSDFTLARLKPEGTLDSSFAINGKQATTMVGPAQSNASILQEDSKIVLSGYVDRTFKYALARYNNDAILPLHFAYFNAAPTNNGGIVLNWQTAQENNNNYFAVERSSNNNFNELTRINSQGNSSQAQTYSYTDNTPLQGTNFYRLKQVDKDGKFSYSQVVSATVHDGLTVLLFPNPVRDILNIKGLDAGMSFELKIINAKGSVVAKTSINNTSSYKWNLRSLSKGVYYLKAESGTLNAESRKTTVKFVKE